MRCVTRRVSCMTIGGRPVEVQRRRWLVWMRRKNRGCVEFHAGSSRQRQRTTFLNEDPTYEKVWVHVHLFIIS